MATTRPIRVVIRLEGDDAETITQLAAEQHRTVRQEVTFLYRRAFDLATLERESPKWRMALDMLVAEYLGLQGARRRAAMVGPLPLD